MDMKETVMERDTILAWYLAPRAQEGALVNLRVWISSNVSVFCFLSGSISGGFHNLNLWHSLPLLRIPWYIFPFSSFKGYSVACFIKFDSGKAQRDKVLSRYFQFNSCRMKPLWFPHSLICAFGTSVQTHRLSVQFVVPKEKNGTLVICATWARVLHSEGNYTLLESFVQVREQRLQEASSDPCLTVALIKWARHTLNPAAPLAVWQSYEPSYQHVILLNLNNIELVWKGLIKRDAIHKTMMSVVWMAVYWPCPDVCAGVWPGRSSC